jgi:hypothetical protein
MQKYTDVVTSARSGSAIPSASVTVKTSPGGVTATIYSDDGVTTQANPLTTDSNGEFTFYAADGEYTLTVSGTGITERTVGPIILHDPADSDDYMPSTDVSFTQSGSGAVATNVQTRMRLEVWAADCGHSTSAAAADNDTYLINAMNAVYDAGGGTVHIGAGTFEHITVPFNWEGTVSVKLKGSGKRSTILKKSGATSSSVLNFSTDAGILEAYSNIEDLRIQGNAKGHHGITLTRFGRSELKSVRIDACDTALDCNGALVLIIHDPSFQSNNVGIKTVKSGTVYCNLINVFGGNITANTTHGLDLGDCGAFQAFGTDISSNGTTGNTATGAVITQDTVDDESGQSAIAFNGCWFEDNLGMAVTAEAANLALSFRDCQCLGNESGNVMSIGDIRSLVLDNVMATANGDTITVAAKNLIVIGGNIHTLTDNSTQSSVQLGLGLSSGTTKMRALEWTARMGTSTTFSPVPSVAHKDISAVGNVGGGEDDLMSYTLPANALSAAGKGVRITANGTTANNSNPKTVKLYFGGTEIATLALTVSQVNAWRYCGEVIFRGGVLYNSDIQLSQGGTTKQTNEIATTLNGPDPTGALIIKATATVTDGGGGINNDDVLMRKLLVEFIN